MKNVAGRACLVLLALQLGAAQAFADPREIAEPAEPPTPEQKEAQRLQMADDLDAWLRRLEGRYRIEGVFMRDGDEASTRTANGMQDCITIGPGAGMQCVLSVVWDEYWGADGMEGQIGVSALSPAMIEYGFDPVVSRVRSLQVDNQSLAEAGEGRLKGETVTYAARCANTPAAQLCQRVTRIWAPANGGNLRVTIDVERNYTRVSSLMLDLQRLAPGEMAGNTPEARRPR